MKIALYGIGGTYNYGCDAIVEGTEKIIHYRFPNAIIDYYSYDYVEDKKRLENISINVLPIYPNIIKKYISKITYRIDKIINKARKQNTERLTSSILFNWVKKYDYILSIGGDIYTLPPVVQRNNEKKYTNRLLEFDKYCTRKNVSNIVWGASIGPFDDDNILKEIYINHLKRNVKAISAREMSTYRYLKDNGLKNIHLFADPAFVLEGDYHKEKNERITIGINLSPLASSYSSKNESLNLIQERQIQTIIKIWEFYHCRIYLIPHVYSKYTSDSDYLYLKKIYEKLVDVLGCDVEMWETGSFLETKKVLAKCDLCLSARMHCAINAITSYVPAVFLSYSEKARGMCEAIYGTKDYVLDIHDFENFTFINRIINKIMVDYGSIIKQLENRIETIKDTAFDSASVL